MASSQDLRAKLVEILGSSAVYFQPPLGFQMEYPCIVFNLSDVNTRFADNRPYNCDDEYLVTYMTKDPESLVRKKIQELPKCLFERFFISGGLNHYVYRLYI